MITQYFWGGTEEDEASKKSLMARLADKVCPR